jgi:TonB family protein
MKATENTNKLDNLIDELEQSNVNQRHKNILLMLLLIVFTAFIAYLFYNNNQKDPITESTTISIPKVHAVPTYNPNNINTPPHKTEDKQKLGVLAEVTLNHNDNHTSGRNRIGAQFPNGSEGVTQYLQENVIYPDDAFDNEIEGKVLAQITIDEKGRVINPTIVESLGHRCDEEVIRVLSKMPNWKPAIFNNIPTEKSYILTVSFSLD